MEKCLNCGSDEFTIITPPAGTTYVITTLDENSNPPKFNPAIGSPVKLYGCPECGFVSMNMPSIKNVNK